MPGFPQDPFHTKTAQTRRLTDRLSWTASTSNLSVRLACKRRRPRGCGTPALSRVRGRNWAGMVRLSIMMRRLRDGIRFDPYFDHILLLIDARRDPGKALDHVVGVYRVMRDDQAAKGRWSILLGRRIRPYRVLRQSGRRLSRAWPILPCIATIAVARRCSSCGPGSQNYVAKHRDRSAVRRRELSWNRCHPPIGRATDASPHAVPCAARVACPGGRGTFSANGCWPTRQRIDRVAAMRQDPVIDQELSQAGWFCG